ncbi:MAG: PQQ-binding-like beta-propeller repeat protein [Candidatus Glassbacteria bacterium]|nr:PQQ-binding-like beta-propeller repeat protein [Candidatus Glassbacteria bacterium]
MKLPQYATLAAVPALICALLTAILTISAPPAYSARKKDPGFFEDFDAQWLFYKGNLGRTACKNPLISVPLELAWKNNVARSIGSTPGAGGEFIFISTRDRRIIILERNSGERVQRRTFKGGFGGSVIIDGTKMYFTTRYPDGKVYGTDINTKDDHLERKIGASVVSPIVHHDRIFAFTQLGEVVSMNTEAGFQNWKSELEGNIEHAPLYIDPFLFVPTIRGGVYKLGSSTGRTIAEFKTDGLLLGDLSSDDYFLFTASSDGRVYCLEPDSLKVEWEVDLDQPLFSGPIYAKGYVYLSVRNGKVLKLAALDGSEVWEAELNGIAVAPPTVTDEYVFTGTKSGELAAFDIESGEKLWEKKIDEGISCSPLVYMDYVYYCTDRGTVYAFHAK